MLFAHCQVEEQSLIAYKSCLAVAFLCNGVSPLANQAARTGNGENLHLAVVTSHQAQTSLVALEMVKGRRGQSS